MSSISHDLTLFHLWDYWDINLRWSLQPDRILCKVPVISPSSNLPSLSGHPPLPGSQEENKDNGDSQARQINNSVLDKDFLLRFHFKALGTGRMDCLRGFILHLGRARDNLLSNFG